MTIVYLVKSILGPELYRVYKQGQTMVKNKHIFKIKLQVSILLINLFFKGTQLSTQQSGVLLKHRNITG